MKRLKRLIADFFYSLIYGLAVSLTFGIIQFCFYKAGISPIPTSEFVEPLIIFALGIAFGVASQLD